jgi:hypothetical protein
MRKRERGKESAATKQALDNRPTVYPDNRWIHEAFNLLNNSRPFIPAGMGGAAPAPIPFEALDRFAARFGPHSVDDFERFVNLVTAMDNVYVQHQIKEISKKAKAKK